MPMIKGEFQLQGPCRTTLGVVWEGVNDIRPRMVDVTTSTNEDVGIEGVLIGGKQQFTHLPEPTPASVLRAVAPVPIYDLLSKNEKVEVQIVVRRHGSVGVQLVVHGLLVSPAPPPPAPKSFLTVDLIEGLTLEDASKEVVRLATSLGVIVRAMYRGHMIAAMPGEAFGTVQESWLARIKA